MTRDEEMIAEALAKVEALVDHLGVKLEERPCPSQVCRLGRWPDGGFCTTCGGSARVYVVTPPEPTGSPERLETYEEDDDD